MNPNTTNHAANIDAKFANTATKVCINHKTVKPGNFNCDSTAVVYLIYCQNAKKHNILVKQVKISDTDFNQSIIQCFFPAFRHTIINNYS